MPLSLPPPPLLTLAHSFEYSSAGTFLSLSLSHTHTHSLTHSLTHTHSDTHTPTLRYTQHTHTHTHTHKHIHSNLMLLQLHLQATAGLGGLLRMRRTLRDYHFSLFRALRWSREMVWLAHAHTRSTRTQRAGSYPRLECGNVADIPRGFFIALFMQCGRSAEAN